MELSDMLDTLHYFMEEDFRYRSGEEYEAVNSVRSYMYQNLYGVSYKYKGQSLRGGSTGGRQYVNQNASWDDLPAEFSNNETKPYIPPTQMNAESALPFGDILDSPLN